MTASSFCDLFSQGPSIINVYGPKRFESHQQKATYKIFH